MLYFENFNYKGYSVTIIFNCEDNKYRPSLIIRKNSRERKPGIEREIFKTKDEAFKWAEGRAKEYIDNGKANNL